MGIERGLEHAPQGDGKELVLNSEESIRTYLRAHPEELRSVKEILLDGRIAIVSKEWEAAKTANNTSEIERLGKQLSKLGEERREARTRRDQGERY